MGLALAAWPAARADAPPWLDARGELSVTSTVQRTATDALPSPSVANPLTLALRLDATAKLGERAALVAVLAPSAAAGRPDAPAGEPLVSVGLQDAYLRLTPNRNVELAVGAQRWPLGELRLAPTLRLEPVDRFGTERGLSGARLTAYQHPWRLRVGAISPLDDDLRPTGWGGVASLRWDVASWTFEATAFAGERSGAGTSTSGTIDRVVLNGDAWLLSDPWEVRGGLGASGYIGGVLVTGEAAWAPADGALNGDARPAVRLSAQASLDRDLALDVIAGIAWPHDPGTLDARTMALDATAVLTIDQADAVLSLAPTIRHGLGTTSLGVSLTVRTFF
jgi:hypothetical protein